MSIYGEKLIDLALRGDNLHSKCRLPAFAHATLHTETDFTL